MRCDVLEIRQQARSPKEPSYVTLKATGDCKLEGRTFYARADEITVDKSKDLFKLSSSVPQKATIWRQVQVGGEWSQFDAQRWEVIPSRNQWRSDRTSGLEGLQ
jgi:hypothetical protein